MDNYKKFTHFKVHSQYSICEGALKIENLSSFCKKNKIKAIGLSDTSNLCGALEFSENISKSGTQPILGTQINFKFKDEFGLLPIIAKNENGYKSMINLSSKSFLDSSGINPPYCKIEDLYKLSNDIILFTGSISGVFGKLFNKGKFDEINQLYKELKNKFNDDFFIEIQRHDDANEKSFEQFNLKNSNDLKIPIIATNEVFYIEQDMHEAHDALICIGNKSYISDLNRPKYSNQHYLKSDKEMELLFSDIPEALQNNYNLVYKINYRPKFSRPILPNIT